MNEWPQRLGKYEILAVLGQGAMGVVYKGLDPDIERTVAIKVMHPHLNSGSLGEALHERFRREARAAARCFHPNIVAVFDLGQDRGRDYIVMEYVEGEELKQIIQRGHRFSQPEALYIGTELLKALEAAHRQGVVHRDIKPGNMILLADGRIKVADFGVAHTDESELTQTGHLVGTPVYMCPEGLRGEPVDRRADLYSAGMVLLELLTGERVLPRQMYTESLPDLLERIFAGEHGRRLPEGLRQLLRTALAEDPGARFQDASAFIESLERLLHGQEDERTVMRSLAASMSAVSPAAADAAGQGEPAGFVWTPELLKKLERELVTYTGPVAGFLVRKLSASSHSPMELVESLAAHVADTRERAAFLRKARHCMGTGTCDGDTVPGAGTAPPHREQTLAESLPPEQLERLVRRLAIHVGPFARQLVAHHARRNFQLAEFYRQLSSSIPDPDERRRFLTEIGG